MEEKCDKCRFGSGVAAHKCGFLDKVGHTKLHVYREEIGGDLRKAYGPDCVAYQPKSATTKKKKPSATMVVRKEKNRHPHGRPLWRRGMIRCERCMPRA